MRGLRIVSRPATQFGAMLRIIHQCCDAWVLGSILLASNPCVAALMPWEYKAMPGIIFLTVWMMLAIYSIGVVWVSMVLSLVRNGAAFYDTPTVRKTSAGVGHRK